MNFSQGHSGTEVQCESCLFSQGKTPEFTKMGGIHELFVLAVSLVWFAGATPDIFPNLNQWASPLQAGEVLTTTSSLGDGAWLGVVCWESGV